MVVKSKLLANYKFEISQKLFRHKRFWKSSSDFAKIHVKVIEKHPENVKTMFVTVIYFCMMLTKDI